MKSYNKLAIIAGFGSLPLQVINDAISKDWDVTIFSIDGSFKSNSKNYNIIELSYLNIKKISNILKIVSGSDSKTTKKLKESTLRKTWLLVSDLLIRL